ncbi:MAG: hypothetical protein UU93_C0013G0018 [Candidatus Amesbacteria bacterium GW2011_GWA2_42_12]|uniref:Chloroplast import component protein (Tic20) n=1 Tax=Candidatus Amesbacteria bacterium GW2011_GWA2_42_12 TaxID=1618356 RepID=A0A0G1B2W2_9BACT|nr:MAG: hypothetical protein UU93_C0013G0018 [Candidatus Amesbacteria bacterium GW2011_GWA2_42_12]
MASDAPIVGGGKNTAMAVIAYILFFVPLLTGDTKKDAFVKFHTKQGLVLFLLGVLINVVGWIIPFYFWFSISWILSLGMLALLIVGIVNAVNGKQEPLPVIGRFSDVFKF